MTQIDKFHSMILGLTAAFLIAGAVQGLAWLSVQPMPAPDGIAAAWGGF